MDDLKLKEKLTQIISNNKDSKNKEFERGEVTTEGKNDSTGISYKHIPKFYSKLPDENDLIPRKLREEARALFLQRKSNDLLGNEELQDIWAALEKHQTPPFRKAEKLIGYIDFKKAGLEVNLKCRQFFKPSIFSKFLHLNKNNNNNGNNPANNNNNNNGNNTANNNNNNNIADPYGRISIDQFINYAMRKVWLYQTRIGLSLYDSVGLGFLKEDELDNYILELIPSLPQLKDLEPSFYSFYMCTAVRKFIFFLDPLRVGRVRIQDILACSFLDDLLELKDKKLSAEQERNNWFSHTSTMHIYKQYVLLDADQNGMLSRSELTKFNGGSLTPAFLDRVFQECLTYEGEMDYKTYLDFILAIRHRSQPQAVQHIFKILDTQHKGHLNSFDLHFFYRSIMEQSAPGDQIPFEDVKNEIFDMVKPSNPLKITCQDLIKSGQADIIVGMLTDVVSFWAYENREATAQKITEEISNYYY